MTTEKLVGQQNQCASCGRFFARNSAFTRHRVGQFGVDRRCMNAQEMLVTFNLGVDGFFRKKPKEGQGMPYAAWPGRNGLTRRQDGAL